MNISFSQIGVLAAVAMVLLGAGLPLDAYAERLFSSGCELQVPGGSAAMSGVEFAFGGTTPTVETGLKRSGAVSCKTTASSASSVLKHRFASSATLGPYITRFYVYISSAPTNNAALATYVDAAGSNARSVLVLKNDRTLALLNDALTQVSTYTAQPLSTNTWHRIEYRYSHTNGGVQVRLNGVEVMRQATGDGTSAVVSQIELGLYNPLVTGYTSGSGTLYFDDIAINDGVGDIQNSFPGTGSIVHLRPNGAGAVSDCSLGSWTDIDEVTPSSASTPDHCEFDPNTGDMSIDVQLESLPVAIAASYPHITLVQAGAHIGYVTPAFYRGHGRVYIKSTSGGAMSMGTTSYAYNPYQSHTSIEPRNYALTLYGNPSTNCHWAAQGANSLETMLVGYQADAEWYDYGRGPEQEARVYVNTLWVLVEYSTDSTFKEPCALPPGGNLFDPIWTVVNGLTTDLQTKGVGFWAQAIATDQLCFGNAGNCVSSWNRQPKCRLETYRVAARPNAASFPSWNLPDFSTDITTGLCDDMLSASSKAAGWVSSGFDSANRVISGTSHSPRACYFMRLACDTDVQLLQGTATNPEAYPVADFTTSQYRCSNLVDDDNDTFTDYPEDPGCDAWNDTWEVDGAENCPVVC